MSESNIKVVQSVYAAFGRKDIPAVLDLLTPDITTGIVGRKEDAPFLGLHHGHDGVLEFFEQLGEAQEFHTFEQLRYLAAEEKVFVYGRYRWTMRKSGITKESTWLHELTVRNGKISEWLGHNDTAMLAAAYHAR